VTEYEYKQYTEIGSIMQETPLDFSKLYRVEQGGTNLALKDVNFLSPVMQEIALSGTMPRYYFTMSAPFKNAEGLERVAVHGRTEFEAVWFRALFLGRLIELKGEPSREAVEGYGAGYIKW